MSTQTTTLVQGGAAWLNSRVGLITASRVADVMSFLKKGEPSAKRKNYFTEVLCGRLTAKAADHFLTDAMKWGIESESSARNAYEIETGNMVDLVGMFIHPKMDYFGASPDGLIGDVGGFECKCPTTAVHLEYLLAGEVPDEYKPQCYAQMSCAELEFVDFASYDSRLPGPLQIFVKRLHRDDGEIAKIEAAVDLFNHEVNEAIAALRVAFGDFPLPTKAVLELPLGEGYLTDEDFEGLI